MDVLQKKHYNFKERTPCGHTIFFCMIFAGLSRHRCCDIFVGLFPKISHGFKAHWWKETCKDMASFMASPPCSLVSTCRAWEFSILYGASLPCTNCDAACDICVRVWHVYAICVYNTSIYSMYVCPVMISHTHICMYEWVMIFSI